MKRFFRNLVFLVLFAALGFLGWRTVELRRDNATLRETVLQLEQERRELRQQGALGARAVKPEEQAEIRAQIEQETSELRGLKFHQPVNYKMIERSELRSVLLDKVREKYTEQEVRDYGRSLAALGLVPENTDLLEILVGLYDEQVGAFYMPEERALFTFKDLSWTGGLDKMLLAHELTHALQDQNFDLSKFPLKLKNNDDLVMATMALIEGDATVLMMQWYAENIDARSALGDLGAMLRQNTAKLRDAPRFLREILLFPYQQGQEFAMALFMEGGQAALDEAFRKPPTSTEQVLHPEKFLREREEPEPVNVPLIESKDWRLIGNNVLGEFGVRSLLQQHTGFLQAQLAAQGWGGDRYNVYERGQGGQTAVVWVTVWDTEQDAIEFEEAYTSFAEKRQASPPLVTRVVRVGKQVAIQQSADATFFSIAESALAGEDAKTAPSAE